MLHLSLYYFLTRCISGDYVLDVAGQWYHHNNDLHLDDVLLSEGISQDTSQSLHHPGNHRSTWKTVILRYDWLID